MDYLQNRSVMAEEESQQVLVGGIKRTLLSRDPLAEPLNLSLANAARQGHSGDFALIPPGLKPR
jgi:hypothetical protein